MERVICPKENVYFLTDEVHELKLYPSDFLKQFENILSPRYDLNHPNIIKVHELNVWQINKSFGELVNSDKIRKTKNISVVVSDLTILKGQKDRFAFANKLIGHFKDRISAVPL